MAADGVIARMLALGRSDDSNCAVLPNRVIATIASAWPDVASVTAASHIARPWTVRKVSNPSGDFDAFRTGRAMCEAAVTLASAGQAEAIVAVTLYGKTAQLLSSLRPSAHIIAVTPSEVVARRLKLCWGVRPVVSDLDDLRALEGPIRSAIDLSPRAVVVFININPDLSRLDANFLNVQRLAG